MSDPTHAMTPPPALPADLRDQIERYADLLVRVGANVQPGQLVLITGVPLESAPFIRLLVERAYDAGAGRVEVDWQDDAMNRLTVERASAERLAAYPSWRVETVRQIIAGGGTIIQPYAPDPTVYRGLDPARVTMANRSLAEAFQPVVRDIDTGAISSTIVAVPTVSWARVVFPGLADQDAMNRLWDLICKATRADAPDPISAWAEHLDMLAARRDALTRGGFKLLYYRAPGTDLRVELPRGCCWLAADHTTRAGVSYVGNIPTEEVYTAPLRTGVNGTVRSTMPLNEGGTLIEGIAMELVDGRIVSMTAESGQEILEGALETDEGARYLGEIALVPADSPVARLNTLFYNSLFDENASCHIAFGNGYPRSIEGGTEMSPDELLAEGLNASAAHVDFMIGSPELDIDGETAWGEIVPVFRQGRWALPL